MILNNYWKYKLIKSCGTARERPRPRVESHLLRDSSVGIQIQRERSALDSTIRNMTLNNEQIKSSGTARERPRPQVESHPPRDSSVGTSVQSEKCSVYNYKKYEFQQLLEITNWSNRATLHARDRDPRWNYIPLGTSSVGTPVKRERSALSSTIRNMILNNYWK